MSMPNHAATAVLLGLTAALLTGCGEASFLETMGMGKSSPDERLVSTNPPLSVPPDMMLRPPSDAGKPSAPPGGDAPGSLAAPRDGLSAPVRTAAATPPPAAAGNVDANGRPVSSIDKVYIKHGINVYKPDGTHKTTVELNRELAEKIKEEKRRKNPRYGTIFNIGSLFRD